MEEVSDKTSACVVSLQKHVECVTDEEQRGLEVNLTKEVKDPYIANYKTLREEIEEDTNKR